MNRFVVLTNVLLSCWLCVPNLMAESPYAKIDRLRFQRARGKVTLRVVDSIGRPVSNAWLSGAFWPSDSSADADVFEGQTATNGLFIAEGETIHSMNYTITKDDYYKTTGKYWFRRQGEECVRDGRWQPWNPTNTIVLKERRNPIAMYAKNVDVSIPVRDVAVGFDLEKGDWIAPHGAGKEADVFFTYKANAQDFWTGSYELTIACTNKLDGLFRTQKDLKGDIHATTYLMGSELLSTYEAPTNGYQAQVVLCLDITKDKILKKELFGDAEYLMFRVRTVLDDKGNIVRARYGKIYGPIEFGVGKEHHVRFTYYLNPTANDRNLEFDPSRNLLGATDKSRVYQP